MTRERWGGRFNTVILSYLISRGLVLVKVVFPIEVAGPLDIAVERNSSTKRRYEGRGLEPLQNLYKLELIQNVYHGLYSTGWLPGNARSNSATLVLGPSSMAADAPVIPPS